jgi:uncharacterized damage-inducible protein DinB
MKESKRIAGLFSDSYNGDPWLDVTLVGTLKTIASEQAYKKLTPQTNSIWEIVNHLISWRQNVLGRVKGNVLITPDHNYFTPVEDHSAKAWNETLLDFEVSQQNWLHFLNDFDDADFEKGYPNNDHTYYEHIHGILHHDAYHLGQIVLLKKLTDAKSGF